MKTQCVQNPVENALESSTSSQPAYVQARKRLMSLKGDPSVFADWESATFLHFLVSPELLVPHIPDCLELDLYEGQACLSLVSVSMRNFHGRSPVSLGSLSALIDCQRFLNFRTYVHFNNEAGALFLWGWLSNPLPITFPHFKWGLPFSIANFDYQHRLETSTVRGKVTSRETSGGFAYQTTLNPQIQGCPKSSLEEFALERYTGFFSRGSHCFFFRAWHPRWLQTPITPSIEDRSLITNRFPWFENARYHSANFAPGFKDVWLGRVHRLNRLMIKHDAILSGFYEMP